MEQTLIAPSTSPDAKTSRADWQKTAESFNTATTRRPLTTDELAELLRVKSKTIRAGLCRNGHYGGITPIKLWNRRLLWPADQVERLLSGEAAK